MKTISKAAIALVLAAGLTACGGEPITVGPVTYVPGCMILCGYTK